MSVSNVSSTASSVDLTELRKKMAERMAERMLKDLDSDGDGAISKSELAKAGQAASKSGSDGSSMASDNDVPSLDELFSALDADGDGAISKSELSSFMEKAGPPQGIPPNGPPPAGARPSGVPPQGPPNEMESADGSQDTTSSDTTSSSNSSSPTSDPADADGDGTVSAEERMAYAYQQLMSALQRLGDSLEGHRTNTTSIAS